MSQVELAKRYAKALLQLGHQKGQAQEYTQELKVAAEILGHQGDVATFFTNSTVAHEIKKKSLETLFQERKFSDDVKAFLFLLVDRSRMSVLAEIAKAAEKILDEENGITRGKIKSSGTISEETKKTYEKKIGAALGKKIFLEAAVDEKIIGGVRVEVGGWTFDDSLETHLSQMSDQLMKSKN